MRGWRAGIGVLLMLCLIAGFAACSLPTPPAPSGETPPADKPKMADEAETQEALTGLEDELTSILKTLEGLDLVDDEDLIP